MKNMRIHTVLILVLPVILLSCRQSAEKDSLDVIKQFKPEDKYFKAILVSLHFRIETSPVATVDSLFR